jgi:hypothetical protein
MKNTERLNYWLSHNTAMSPTVNNLLVTKGLIQGGEKVKAFNVPKKEVVAEAPAETPVPATEAAPEPEASPIAETVPAEEAKPSETDVEPVTEEIPAETETPAEAAPEEAKE